MRSVAQERWERAKAIASAARKAEAEAGIPPSPRIWKEPKKQKEPKEPKVKPPAQEAPPKTPTPPVRPQRAPGLRGTLDQVKARLAEAEARMSALKAAGGKSTSQEYGALKKVIQRARLAVAALDAMEG